jgi:hypothetical protein
VFDENSEGRNFFTPALIAASMMFFCSKNPPAPTIETMASCPRKAESKLDSEKFVLWTWTPDGKMAALDSLLITEIVKAEESSKACRTGFPMLPVASTQLAECYQSMYNRLDTDLLQ